MMIQKKNKKKKWGEERENKTKRKGKKKKTIRTIYQHVVIIKGFNCASALLF